MAEWMDGAQSLLVEVGRYFILIIIIILFLLVLTGLIWFYYRWKRYKKCNVFVWKRHKTADGKEMPVFVAWDKGAPIKDRKLKKWVFHLKKFNVDLGEESNEDMDEDRDLNLPTIPQENGGTIIFVEQISPRTFAVGRPFIFEGTVKVLVTEADVAEATHSFDINAKYFGNSKWQWVGPIAFAVFAVLIIVLFAVLVNKFDVIKESMQIALEIAKNNRGVGAVASGAAG